MRSVTDCQTSNREALPISPALDDAHKAIEFGPNRITTCSSRLENGWLGLVIGCGPPNYMVIVPSKDKINLATPRGSRLCERHVLYQAHVRDGNHDIASFERS